ncbi:hypothetical protein Xaut_3915 [Xanthobacter versatilis]|uniref:Uncharacterized protein n=1 Tax=Xanthobacter autotrophicus (strain ATCC BAA-1158 / Py2) TaxID=78245 RepID=A7IM96_XANP2|nr:hypothetical protein Xaut_3915 [Xanthobacter autotrophicus Py2]
MEWLRRRNDPLTRIMFRRGTAGFRNAILIPRRPDRDTGKRPQHGERIGACQILPPSPGGGRIRRTYNLRYVLICISIYKT